MKHWLAGKIISILFKDFAPYKPTDKDKLVAFHQAFMIPGFREVLESQLNTFIKQVALRCQNNDEIQFYRGAIFTLQLLLKNMRKYHDAFERDKKSAK